MSKTWNSAITEQLAEKWLVYIFHLIFYSEDKLATADCTMEINLRTQLDTDTEPALTTIFQIYGSLTCVKEMTWQAAQLSDCSYGTLK